MKISAHFHCDLVTDPCVCVRLRPAGPGTRELGDWSCVCRVGAPDHCDPAIGIRGAPRDVASGAKQTRIDLQLSDNCERFVRRLGILQLVITGQDRAADRGQVLGWENSLRQKTRRTQNHS